MQAPAFRLAAAAFPVNGTGGQLLRGGGWWQALGNERSNRIQKEKMFVELLQEERSARLQVFF